MKILPRHGEDRGFSHRSASFSSFMLSRFAAVLVQEQGAHAAAAGRSHAQYYSLVREIRHYC
jgi:hypothetical protein